jgi:hypothetical protein
MLRLLIVTIIALLAIPSQSHGEENAEKEFVANVKKELPSGWTAKRDGSKVVLRRVEEPIIINIINSAGMQEGESQEAFKRRHIVDFKYQIELRLVPKITPNDVNKMIAANEKAAKEIAKLRNEHRTYFSSKNELPRPQNEEERRIRDRYVQLEKSIQQIPDGYFGEFSVFIESTDLGFARFLSDKVEAECEMVKKKVTSILSSYKNDSKVKSRK